MDHFANHPHQNTEDEGSSFDIANWEIYCDESRHDLLANPQPGEYFLLGSLWLPSSQRLQVREDIRALREKHHVWGEFKWTKVSPNKVDFYKDLIELFHRSEGVSFRAIAVHSSDIDLDKYHGSASELGYYKFYYQLLHHPIKTKHSYSIYLDHRSSTQNPYNQSLARVLKASNRDSRILRVQSLRSDRNDLIQFCDARRVINNLNDRPVAWPLNDYDRGKLCAFTAYQATRVSKYRSALVATLQHRALALGLNLEPEAIDDTNLHIQGIAAVSDSYTLDLMHQDMGIFVCPENLLITSVNPAVRNLAYPDTSRPLSTAFPWRATLIPLSPTTLLVFFGDERVNCDKPFHLSEEAAIHLNELQRINAASALYLVSDE